MTKHILITGSTDGIGKLAAIQLAQEGHHVYLHGRSQQKLDTTISEVKNQSGNEKISGFVADFSDLEQVKRMADEVSKLSKLDVLINNAGVYNSSTPTNTSGIDLRMVVNYLAPFALTKELIPLLQQSEEPRVVNLGSAAQSSVSLELLKGNQQSTEQQAYAQSKLALTMWSFYLAKELDDISVIVVNPGSLLHTKMALEAFGNSWSSADKGAQILFDLAVSDNHQGITGKYFDNDQGNYGEAHPDAYNGTQIDRLISMTEQVLYQHLNM
ncbi:MAG: SDR family NAD(P)-dependent oxidoreductase [Cyclobacteriaceae bacterium]